MRIAVLSGLLVMLLTAVSGCGDKLPDSSSNKATPSEEPKPPEGKAKPSASAI